MCIYYACMSFLYNSHFSLNMVLQLLCICSISMPRYALPAMPFPPSTPTAGAKWERQLAMLRAPFLVLSASVGNPQQLLGFLNDAQRAQGG